MSENSIEKEIQINAPVSKVWAALTQAEVFGKWFGAAFSGAFAPGKSVKARNLSKGYEMEMTFHIKELKPEHYFSYAWTPYPMNKLIDYSKEEPTLVEFFLEEAGSGTLLKVKESGFTRISASRRAEAYKMHTGGWEAQLRNIEAFVAAQK